MASSTIHSPLKGDGREFRLLVLEPSADNLAPVRCRLNRASLDDKDLKFTALSYTWGDPLETAPIFVNGVELQATLNLEAALRHIRQGSNPVVLWIDALCINQGDVAEKNVQVGMMKDIYSGAELVIAWLGSAGDDSDLAMDLLGKPLEEWEASARCPDRLEQWEENERVIYLGHGSSEEEEPGYLKSPVIDDEGEHDTPAWSGSEEGDIISTSPQSPASIPASTTPSLQSSSPGAPANAVLASALSDPDDGHQDNNCITEGDRQIIEDEDHIPGHSNASSVVQPSDSGDSDVSDRSDDVQDLKPVISRLTTQESLAILRLLKRSWWTRIWVVQEILLAKKVIFKCGDAEVPSAKLLNWAAAGLDALYALCDDPDSPGPIFPAIIILHGLRHPVSESRDAVDYLTSYGMRAASRPHDHIYGLLGFIPAKDRALIGEPDYDSRAEDVFTNVTTKLMVGSGSLELLLAAGLPAPQEAAYSTRLDLPSWVPDWTRPWFTTAPQIDKGSNNVLGDFSVPLFHISDNLKELTVEGIQFDIVESVKPIPAVAKGNIPMWEDDLPAEECAPDDRIPPVQRIIVALLLHQTHMERLDSPRGRAIVCCFLQELEEYRASLNPGGDHDYLAGFLEWIGEERDGREDNEIFEKIFSTEDAYQFFYTYNTLTSVDQRRLYRVYTVFRKGMFGAAGYTMFRTYKGSFGTIQTAAAAAGDILCAVPTCQVPLVLRKVGSSRYLLVGPTSQIAGTLNGEIGQAAKDGELTWEKFTLV